MLVLTRKAGEAICIGDDIELRIVSVRGQKVRLAIEAPREVSVRRSELTDEVTPLSAPHLTRERQPVRTGSSQRRAVG